MKKLLLNVCMIFFAYTSFSTVHIVTSSAEGDTKALRSIINSASSGDTIDFQVQVSNLGGQIIVQKDLVFKNTLGIPVTITTGGSGRIFRVDGGASIEFNDITFSNGSEQNGGAFRLDDCNVVFNRCIFQGNKADASSSNVQAVGGAIYVSNLASCHLTDCSFNFNTAINSSGDALGGAIYSRAVQSTDGLSIMRCTFYQNEAESGVMSGQTSNKTASGGAIMLSSIGASESILLNIENSTFASNVLRHSSKGVLRGLAIGVIGTGGSVLNIVNSTFSQNSGEAMEGGSSVTPYAIHGQVDQNSLVQNNIVYGNTFSDPNLGSMIADLKLEYINLSEFSIDPLASSGYNLIGLGSIFATVSTDVVGVDPNLGLFGNYGGVTNTFNLPCTSPAVDAGFNTLDNPNDQTGNLRGIGVADDIGAYEFPNVSVADPEVSNLVGVVCKGDSNGYAEIVNPKKQSTYSWSNLVSGGANSSLSNGNHYVVEIDQYGCLDTAHFMINEPKNALEILGVVTNETGTAMDGAIDVTVTGGGAGLYGYLWDDPNMSTTKDIFGLDGGRDYTIEVTDSRGCIVTETFMLGNITSLWHNNTSIDELLIYPQPVSEIIYLSSDNDIRKVEIFNLNGELLSESHSSEINISEVRPGVYLLKAHLNNRFITRKIIIQ